MNTLAQFFETYLPQIEAEMLNVVSTNESMLGEQPHTLTTMSRYHLGFANADGTSARIASGKRIRPILVLLTCLASGGSAETAMPAAAAVELLHNFSLIHDDIEDGDDLRRGRLTLWRVWGLAQGVNTGDAMFALAHLALERLTDHGVPAERVIRALRVFDQMCLTLTIGQHLDIGFEQRTDVTAAEYMHMIEGKTAALTRACCEIGGIVAGANDDQVMKLGAFGRGLGIAFQLQDDILGIFGDSSVTGKGDGDLTRRKKTLPVLRALDRDHSLRPIYYGNAPLNIPDMKERIEGLGGRSYTANLAEQTYADAIRALDHANLNPEAVNLLKTLAQSLLGRTS